MTGRADGTARARVATVALSLAAALWLACAPPLAAQQLAMARIPLRTPAAADSLRRLGIDVVEVSAEPAGGATAVAVVSPRDRDLLVSRGWFPEEEPRAPLLAAMEARRAALGTAAFTVYRDFDDPSRGVAAYLRSLAASRSNVTVDSVGASVEGRPVLAAKVGPVDDSPSRPNVVFAATYHAREWAATETALRLVAFLADSLPLRPGGAALLSGRDVWVIPVVNPDGYQYTFTTERLWRKNRRNTGGGIFGVDLNRNHAGFFGFDAEGSSPTPSDETYRGPSAESEPETRAVAAFHRAHPPVIGVSYHSYAGLVLYPWSHAPALFAGDQPVFEALAGTAQQPAVLDSVPGSRLAAYASIPGWQFYSTNGDYDGWAYRELGTLAFTVEVTSGCCLPGGGRYYFEFPDDEALLSRVFRDNLPFALSLIAAAGDPAGAVGPSGVAAPDARFESLWPRAVVSVPAAAAGLTVDVATGPGGFRSAPMAAESLGAGRFASRHASAEPALAGARAERVSRAGLTEEVLAREGAEWEGSPWAGGFRREAGGVEGTRSWTSHSEGGPARISLASPEIATAGRTGLRLYFWTRHFGGASDPAPLGRVEVSSDGGATWTEVWRVVGQSPAWYPVAVPLTPAEGAASVRVRFGAADGAPWWLDAILVAAGGSRLLDSSVASQGPRLELSANPVRQPPLVLTWPATAGDARVQIFSLYGTLVAEETLAGDPGLWRWNLETRSGQPVANGAYIAVVARGDGARLRRRFFVTRAGS